VWDVAKKWNQIHENDLPFRTSVVDVWQLTDNRPETSSEGRHWVYERTGDASLSARPLMGEAERTYICRGLSDVIESAMDWMWDDFVNERVTV